MHEGILSTVGHTPLVRLAKLLGHARFNLFAKLEAFNPGGSIKDRSAVHIIQAALQDGSIGRDTTIVESSSGNMGIGLAMACSYLGLRFICVVDSRTTSQNIRILEAYGAEIELVTTPDPQTGEFLPARIQRVKSLLSEIESSFWPDQYSNIYNARAHHRTMDEIATELDGKVDYLFCSTSTCGTLRGCAEYKRMHHLATKIVAIDAVGSVIFGDQPGSRLIPGHGAAIKPDLYQDGLCDRYVHVSDRECVVNCWHLVKHEAILAGGSSGGVLAGARRLQDEIPNGANCVLIFADRGERYLDTIYSKVWLCEHFGAAVLDIELPAEELSVSG
jgi:2,3-diaminopropionate biosynthesis protein SbnA